MKRMMKKMTFVAITAVSTLVTAIFFQSCSQDSESVPVAETQLITEQAFANDLRRIANIRYTQMMIEEPFCKRAGEVEPTAPVELPIGTEIAVQTVAEIIDEITQKYDLTSDLTAHEIDGLTITDEQREIFVHDPIAYLDYIEEYKSDEYYNIVASVLQDPSCRLSVESVIQNENLKMNEKVDLIATAVLSELVIDEDGLEPKPMGPDGYEIFCGIRRYIAKQMCIRAYRARIESLSLNKDERANQVSQALAELMECDSNAESNYKKCMKDNDKKDK